MKFLDQRLAVAVEGRVDRRSRAAALAALATAASSSRCGEALVTGSLGVILAMFQWLRSRIAAITWSGSSRLADLPVGHLGWFLMIQAIPSGLFWRLLTGV